MSSLSKAKLSVVHAELKRIAKANRGRLRPADVIEAARPTRSVLHPYFEWRDGIAAAKYRLIQAATLIRVTVEMIDMGGEAKAYRAFVSLSSDRQSKGGYRSITAVMSNPVWRAQLLEDAMAELQAFRLKYKGLVELAAVFEAVDAVKT